VIAFIKDLSIILAGAVALITFVTGTYQYLRQNRYTRVQHFVDMRRRFLENPTFRELLELLAKDDPKLNQMPVQDRRNLVGFFEEVALLMNSGILQPQVTRYMFGYYVRLIDSSLHFWEGLDKGSVYWTVFRDLARQLEALKVEPRDARELKF
jgi:hypothetical protein